MAHHGWKRISRLIQMQVFERSKLHTDLGNAVFCAPNCTAALSHLGIHPEETRGVLYRGVSESCKPKEAAPALKTRGCLQNKFMDESCNVSQARNITAEERAAWLAVCAPPPTRNRRPQCHAICSAEMT